MAIVIVMPRLSPTMEEGVLAKWLKQEGAKIAPGDIVAEVETDKANMDFPLEEEGVLLKQLARAGDTVKLGAPVAIVGEAGEDIAALLAEVKSTGAAPLPTPAQPAPAPAPAGGGEVAPQKESPQAQAESAPEPQPSEEMDSEGRGRILASPLARRLADEAGLDVRKIAGSGPGGRIVKRDIERAIAESKSAAAPPPAAAQAAASLAPAPSALPPAVSSQDELVPLSMMRRTAAKRLVEAKQTVPHIYLTTDAAVDALWEFRERLNQTAAAAGGDKVSVNDLVLKALARALRAVPAANVSFASDGQHAIRHHRVDISVAVALGEGDGLITPVVRNAAEKSVGALSKEVRELAQRGREKKLRPEEYTGGTFSLTNLGMYGIREFCAIINPPESGILAVGRVEKRPVVVEIEGRDEVRIGRRMTLTLSCDHRIMDGVLGALLLAEVVRGLEQPMLLVL